MSEKSPYLIEEMGFWDIGKRCPKCGSPLHIAGGQDFAICWQCIVNKETARRGRELLARIRKQVAETKPAGPISPFTFGMPL